MKCPVCTRELAPTLSICLTCGAMMNDSVREELQTKISPVSVSGRLNGKTMPPAVPRSDPPAPKSLPEPPRLAPPPAFIPERPSPKTRAPKIELSAPKKVPSRYDTAELLPKKTSPTLVGFQTRNAALPDWRLQLQNSIRQRSKQTQEESVSETTPQRPRTSGANALKTEPSAEEKPMEHANPRVANALKRIENSRRAFQPAEVTKEVAAPSRPAPARTYPFDVVARNEDAPALPAEPRPAKPVQKPRLVSSLRIEKRGLDTNKLPPLPKPAKFSSSFGLSMSVPDESAEPASRDSESSRILIEEKANEISAETFEQIEVDEVDEEVDDLAPLPMRFNAGLFDLIIGGFAGLAALSPFMISGGSWMSVSGALAMAAAVGIVTFIYLTASVAFFGRTIGMRLFSLELIDADSSEYPTIHQSAVNSAVFILSLVAAGVGFIPMFFNEERRAAHDLLSNTLLVKEY